ncbi:hypothetical protein [Methyloversatilis thermotolerans]|uniref:hypothetical protein n=1 Tax=Methyloversatilis thermotolerans TaxID=1346290 RepID=UPI0012F9E6B0|nr:hypothetical protein [Methyloversatilis thermotolerans]
MAIIVALAWGAGLYALRRDLRLAWREPCLRRPVLVFEGDDWGYGPLDQVAALHALTRVLSRHADAQGRHPVMTLGIILSGPHPARPEDLEHGLDLDDPALAPVLEAIRAGVARGVFSLQLHGMQHYHPAVLERAMQQDAALQAWRWHPLPCTEDLPAPLQSRWTDASVLPSRPLPRADVAQRARAEVELFQRVFGRIPAVAVPPTFVWNDAVEAAWADAGVIAIVTPGERYERRGADGLPEDTGRFYRNGERSDGGLVALVRDDYYEPVRGHGAGRGLAALDRKWAQRRPLLLETHRANFVGRHARLADSLEALDSLLEQALRRRPDLCFVSVEALAHAYGGADADRLFDHRPWPRARALPARLLTTGRRRKLSLALVATTILVVLSAYI